MNLHQQQQQQQQHHHQQQQQLHHHHQQQQQQQQQLNKNQNNNNARVELPLKKATNVTGTGTTLYPITITQINNNAQKCVHPNKNYINNNKSSIMSTINNNSNNNSSTLTTTAAAATTTIITAITTTTTPTTTTASDVTCTATTTTATASTLKRKHSISPGPPQAPPLARSPSPDGSQDYDVTRMREEDFERLAVYIVPDVQCERGIPNRADKTLPRSLTLKPSMVYSTPNVKTEGVWSTGVIPRGTRFGPFEGVPTPNYPNDKNTARYFWRVSMVTPQSLYFTNKYSQNRSSHIWNKAIRFKRGIRHS